MKLSIRLISLIVTLVYLIENTGLHCLPSIARAGSDALRPMSSAIPFNVRQIPQEYYPTVKKGSVEHTIAGVYHFGYSPEDINREIKDKDKIIFEGFRSRRRSLANIIYRIAHLPHFVIERIQYLLTGKRRFQNFYVGKLIREGNEILALDVFFRRATPYTMKLAIFNVLCIITVLAMVLGFTCLPWLIIPAVVLLALTAIYKIFLAQLFDSAINIIDDDFRELVHATKLAYLPELFKKSDLKTVTIAGQAHRQRIIDYLEDDEARQKRWQDYATDPWLRLRLRRYLDIEKSMEICRKTAETEGLEVIGTIAGLPGPKRLIEAMKFRAKPPTRTDRMAARIILYSPPVLLVFAILAILIKLSSKGPVFFEQRRVGHNGEATMVYKFRTWTNETEGAQRKLTTIGYIISALRLDEWAQLRNIKRGDMKFIGPRPLIPSQVDDEYIERVLSMVWPGLVSRSALIRAWNLLDGLPAIDTIDFDIEDAQKYSFLYNVALTIMTIRGLAKLGYRMFINEKRNSTKRRILNTVANNRSHVRITANARPATNRTRISRISQTIRMAFEAHEQVNITPVPEEPMVQPQRLEAEDAASLNIPIRDISSGRKPESTYASVAAPTDVISGVSEVGEQVGILPVPDELMVQPKGLGACSVILLQAKADIVAAAAA